MNKLYSKLAADNIKKNSKTYFPYVITCIFTIAMYYIIKSLSLNSSLKEVSSSMVTIIGLGNKVVALFALIFLFYSNSFLIKRRKKEFGLLNILGMEKRHIAKVIFFETVYIAAISLVLGLVFGIIFDKLMYLIIIKAIGCEVTLGFYISSEATIFTIVLFAVIFLLIFLDSLRQIHLAKPVELLKSGNTGEKEPKTKWIMAILGVIFLGVGYFISITTKKPVSALTLFLFAVILVILGTYFLFTAGSIAFLKLLKKNKKYYYKTKHFTSVSGMIYRMKQNAVGLANICILSTMVLVMISTTSSFMAGMDDILKTRFPYSFMSDNLLSDVAVEGENEDFVVSETKKYLNEYNIPVKNEIEFRYYTLMGKKESESSFTISHYDDSITAANSYIPIYFYTADEYNKAKNLDISLESNDDVYIISENNAYTAETFSLNDMSFNVKKILKYNDTNFISPALVTAYRTAVHVIVNDYSILEKISELHNSIDTESGYDICLFYGADVDSDADTQLEMYSDIMSHFKEYGLTYDGILNCREAEHESFMALYGSLFFLGVFLGALFLMATILIIYYKQISEGYDDKERFEIMQKVGMSQNEVKSSIKSQIMTVFFLPLIIAGIHVAFAFPIVKRLLLLMNMTNTALYIKCTILCFIIFAVFYVLVYLLTAKIYYKIVKR